MSQGLGEGVPLRMGPLYREHVLLGARLTEPTDSEYLMVAGYANEGASDAGAGALLADLTGITYRLLSGANAQALAEAALTGRRLSVGECAFEAALTGDGGLASVVLLARTGDAEYVLLDPSERGGVLASWLEFLIGIEQDGFAPYAETSLQDADGMLVPLMLAGPSAPHVLGDYLSGASRLPRRGAVATLALDAIQTLVAHVPCDDECYLVLVPVGYARAIWRSLLSFSEVEPCGHDRLLGLCETRLPWGRLPAGTTIRPTRDELRTWGVLRLDGGFVGERTLS